MPARSKTLSIALLALALILSGSPAMAEELIVEQRTLDVDATGICGLALGLLTTLRHLPVVMLGLLVGGLANVAGESARWKLPFLGAAVLGGVGWGVTEIVTRLEEPPELFDVPESWGLMAVILLGIMLFFRFGRPVVLSGTMVVLAVLPFSFLWLPLFEQAIEPGRLMMGIMAGFAACALAGQGFAGVLRQTLSESSLKACALGICVLAGVLLNSDTGQVEPILIDELTSELSSGE
ncbi:MAG: hypothetical protein Alpg2KO_31480 [Alphaproteobacteria bacterium]